MRASDLVDRLNDMMERYGNLRVGDTEGAEVSCVIHVQPDGPAISDNDYFELHSARF